jgi:hypothetical protein
MSGASWWWTGELGGAESDVVYAVFLETFQKAADAHAIFRASISDGVSSWTTEKTRMELLNRHTSSRMNVITELVSLLDSGKSDSLRVVAPDRGSGPEIIVRVDGRDAGCIEFDTASKDSVSNFVDTIMPYLEFTGSKAVDEEIALRNACEGSGGAALQASRAVEERVAFNEDMANRLRLLMISKRDHQHPDA